MFTTAWAGSGGIALVLRSKTGAQSGDGPGRYATVREGSTSRLIDLAKDGDQEAWAALYKNAYPRLLAYAGHRLGSNDEARDAVAEVMVRAVANIERFTGGDDSFSAWLVGICRNVVTDAQRAKYRFTREPLQDYASSIATPLDYLMAEVERDLMRQAFARLSAEEREVLELRVVARLTSEDVAHILRSQPSAVRMSQMRALQRLRTFVEELSHVD